MMELQYCGTSDSRLGSVNTTKTELTHRAASPLPTSEHAMVELPALCAYGWTSTAPTTDSNNNHTANCGGVLGYACCCCVGLVVVVLIQKNIAGCALLLYPYMWKISTITPEGLCCHVQIGFVSGIFIWWIVFYGAFNFGNFNGAHTLSKNVGLIFWTRGSVDICIIYLAAQFCIFDCTYNNQIIIHNSSACL